MKKRSLFRIALLLVGVLLMGCGTKAVYITVTRPAEVNLKNFDKIAVGEIKVNGSGVFSEELTQVLFESERFEVLDHESLKMSLSQNDLVMSSLMDGGNEEEIRKIFGNIALISGNITESEYDEDLTSRESKHKDKETGKVTTTRTYYRTGTARVSASLRVMDLRTAKILAKRNFTKSKSATKSRRNSRPAPIDSLALLEACREKIIGSFMRMIAPYTERVRVSFETAKEMPELASGFNMAKVGNWDAAIDIFQQATAAHSASPLVHKAYYNLGLSYMYIDRFDEARTALEEAYVGKPESKYKKAIDELNVRIEDTRRLEEQRRVDPDAAEGDSGPMQEQGQLGPTLASGGRDGTVRLWSVATGEQFARLRGHTAPVYSVSFSPDGSTLASGGRDGTVRLWDVATGDNIATLKGHTDWVFSLSFSPDGSTLAAGALDTTVRLWDVATGEQTATLKGHTAPVLSLSFSPDGSTLAAGADTTVRLWDVATGEQTATLKGHTDGVSSVSFSPDGFTLASGALDTTVRLWDVATGEQTATLKGHTDGVSSVSFSPDGSTLAAGGGDTTVRLWDMATGEQTATLKGHRRAVLSVSFSPDGSTLASGSLDATVRLWDVATGEQLATLGGHTDGVTSVYSVSFSPDGSTLAAGSNDGTILLWDMAEWTNSEPASAANKGDGDYRTWHLPDGALARLGKGSINAIAFSSGGQYLAVGSGSGVWIYDVATFRALRLMPTASSVRRSLWFSPDGETLASGGWDGTVRLWSVATGEQLATLQGHTDKVRSVSFSPDGATLASGSLDETVRLWDVATGAQTATLGHTAPVLSLSFSPDGATLAAGSWDRMIRLWSVATGTQLATLTLGGHRDEVESLWFSPDGETLVSAGTLDGTVRLWDVATGEQTATLQGHTDKVLSVSFSPDGATLASGSWDGTVRLWDVATGEQLATLRGHTRGVESLSFSPDGETLASGSWDRMIRLWSVATGAQLATLTLEGHRAGVYSLSFSPDGETLASGAGDETVRLWDVATSKQTATLRGHTGWVRSLSFSPDGATLASGGDDGTVRLWEVPTGEQAATLQGHTDEVRPVSFSPDGATLASGSRNGTVRLWDVATSKQTATLQGHTSDVSSLSFSPDGSILASAGADNTVRLWDVATGEPLATLQGHTAPVLSVSFSPDGETLASGSWDATVRLWSVATGDPLATLQGHTDGVLSVSFSPDGETLASGGDDNTIVLWGVATGDPLATLRHRTGVYSVSFSPDGFTLASGAGNGTILLWDMEPYITPSTPTAIDAASPSLPAQTTLLVHRCTPEEDPNANVNKNAEGRLTICLQNGKLLTFQDNPQDGEAHSIHSVRYYPELNSYLHKDLGWEWISLEFINADTGETIPVDGEPVFSPTGKSFMTSNSFDATCFFSIYRAHQDQTIEQTFSISPGYDPGAPGKLSENGLPYYSSEPDNERNHFEQELCHADKTWIDDHTILLYPAQEAPKGTAPTKLIYRENEWLHVGTGAGNWCNSTQTVVASFQLQENGKTASICRDEANTLIYSFGVLGGEPELEYRGPVLGEISARATLWGEGVSSLAELTAALGDGWELRGANGFDPADVAKAAQSRETNGFYAVDAATGLVNQGVYIFRKGGWEYAISSTWGRPINVEEDELDDYRSYEITVISPEGKMYHLR